MTVVSGSIAAVDMAPTDGTLTAWSERLRPGGTVMVTSERRQVPIVGGEFSVDLIPGPTEMVISAAGINHPLSVTVPSDVDSADFQDLVGAEFVWEPEVIQAAQQAAAESRKQAEASKRFRDEAEGLYGDLDAVRSARSDAQAAAGASSDSAGESAGSAGAAGEYAAAAEASAGAASSSEDAAATSAEESAESASAASSSEDAAAGSASNAAESAGAAAADREQTGKDRVQTGEDVKGSAGERERAESAADAAEASAGAAASSASSADKTVRDAVAEVTATTKGHADRADAAAERAKGSQSAAKGSADAAAESAQAAAEIALGDLPGATVDTRGLIVLAGDLAGPADAPCVPGLMLSAPGASLSLRPGGEGWSNARNISAARGEAAARWVFDGEWLKPPAWLGRVYVTVDWCGRTPVMLRGERPDGSAVTISTVEGSEPEMHRQITSVVDLGEYPRLAVAATWTAEDVDAGCLVSLLVRPMPAHKHTMGDLSDWPQVDSTLVKQDDDRLSDSRNPLSHRHKMTDITGLDDELNSLSDGVQAARDHADSLLVMVDSEDNVGDESGVLYLVAEEDQ